MKRDKLRIGVITAALAMMIAGGVLTWQQGCEKTVKADQAKQGETAQLTEDEAPELQNSRGGDDGRCRRNACRTGSGR